MNKIVLLFKKKKRPVIFAIAVLLAVLCVAGILIYLFWETGAEKKENFIGVEKGNGLTEEEAEQILLSDISDEEWQTFDASNEILSEIASRYADEDGYIPKEDTGNVINDVMGKINDFYNDGIVSWYSCDENGVSFEYSSGLRCHFVPSLEGYASGGENVNILAIDPFENDPGNNTMTDQACKSGKAIMNQIPKQTISTYVNESVTVKQLKDLPKCEILLWNGHGTYDSKTGPLLMTRQSCSDRYKISLTNLRLAINDIEGLIKTADVNGVGSYWCITNKFVEKFISLDHGLVYLSACQSGRDDTLAQAFLNAGAEVVFVNVGETDVNTLYSQTMLAEIVGYMDGSVDGIFHTASEALELGTEDFADIILDNGGITFQDTKEHYATLEELIQSQGGTHVDIRGEGDYEDYTLCSGIHMTVSFDDSLTQEEVSDIKENLYAKLTDEDGNHIYTYSLSDNSDVYFNLLEPGTYYVTLYEGEWANGQRSKVTVEKHRFTAVELPYKALVSLEGYVYDTEGNPLSNVAVSAEMTSDQGESPAESSSDEKGYYRIKVPEGNEYTLSYNLQGYQSKKTDIKQDMYDKSQSDTAIVLDDVYLEKPAFPDNNNNIEESEGNTYWVIFREGFRNSRIELSTVKSNIDEKDLSIVWKKNMTLNNTTGMSQCSQYYLTKDGAWEYMREYPRLTDYATEVIASNLNVYDADGNLVVPSSDYADVDLNNLEH